MCWIPKDNIIWLLIRLFIGILFLENTIQAFKEKGNGIEITTNETIVSELLKRLYKADEKVRPGVYGAPTIVYIDFFVQGFGTLDESAMALTADLDFRSTWEDHRLTFNSSNDRPLFIPNKDVQEFWIPDIYFPNSKSGEAQKITIPNRSIRIYPNGTVVFFTRIGVTFQCTMYLKKFPLDSQECFIKISTYSYDAEEILVKWKDDTSIEIKEDELNLPEMELGQPKQIESCVEEYKTGNFSCIMASFIFERKVGFFVLQTYIPSILIIMLSWVAFWINKNSEPARITLGVTTVLTMTTQLTTSRSNSMRVSYPKAIDVWYSACMIFVFGALLEYALVNISVRTENKQKQKTKEPVAIDIEKQKLTSDVESGHVDQRTRSNSLAVKLENCKKSLTSKDIDHISRKMFPAAFVIFNIVYWIIYICF